VSRRTALPGADELFRSTGDGRSQTGLDEPSASSVSPIPAELTSGATPGAPSPRDAPGAVPRTAVTPVPDLPPEPGRASGDPADDLDALTEAADAVRRTTRRRPRALSERRPTGRERHEEKITVYVSQDELMDLEHARLMLRGDHGLPVDRGRVVREALAVVLADFEVKGEASILVRRLRGR